MLFRCFFDIRAASAHHVAVLCYSAAPAAGCLRDTHAVLHRRPPLPVVAPPAHRAANNIAAALLLRPFFVASRDSQLVIQRYAAWLASSLPGDVRECSAGAMIRRCRPMMYRRMKPMLH